MTGDPLPGGILFIFEQFGRSCQLSSCRSRSLNLRASASQSAFELPLLKSPYCIRVYAQARFDIGSGC